MSPLTISIIVFACVLGGGLLGVFLHRLLPDHHLSPETKEVVRLGMGLVAPTVALVLGLLVACAKGFYDTQSAEITQFSANMVVLDRVLAHYGPESEVARSALRSLVAGQIELMELPDDSSVNDSYRGAHKGEVVFDKIRELAPKDDNQRSLRAQATSVAIQLGQTRWLMFEQRTVPVPRLLLVMLVSWLAVLFISFGLYASPNPYRGSEFVLLRFGRFRRNFPDSRDVPPFRTDSSICRSIACGTGAAWAIKYSPVCHFCLSRSQTPRRRDRFLQRLAYMEPKAHRSPACALLRAGRRSLA
jgi:hypothetical protein